MLIMVSPTVVALMALSVAGRVSAFDDILDIGTRSVQTCGDPSKAVPLFRAYSTISNDHFYTTNEAEYRNAVTYLGYSKEGVTGYIFPSQEHNTIPLYRLFSLGSGDHFYTTSAEERDSASSSLGYAKEGMAGYVYVDAGCGGHELYRLYSSGASDHFYTMSSTERANAIANLGYTGEVAYLVSTELLPEAVVYATLLEYHTLVFRVKPKSSRKR